MEFREFSEYQNPELKNYDIELGVKAYNNNYYVERLMDLIGILEDVDENELLEDYGITLEEYLHPTADVIAKVENHLENNRGKRK